MIDSQIVRNAIEIGARIRDNRPSIASPTFGEPQERLLSEVGRRIGIAQLACQIGVQLAPVSEEQRPDVLARQCPVPKTATPLIVTLP